MNSFPKSISITVLTGFLGSGKTTLLSEFVKNENVNDVAFIINEFGEVGLDHNLIESSDETVLELQNGCICCTIQEDLKELILSLLESCNIYNHFAVLKQFHQNFLLNYDQDLLHQIH